MTAFAPALLSRVVLTLLGTLTSRSEIESGSTELSMAYGNRAFKKFQLVNKIKKAGEPA